MGLDWPARVLSDRDMSGRVTRALAMFIALPTLVLASCHLVGGTEDLFIDPAFDTQGSGGATASEGGGGAGGVPTTAATGGNGGRGGAGCIAAECPGKTTDCLVVSCVNGQCGAVETATGTACDDDGGRYCNGGGSCVECTDVSHCPPTGVCQSFSCYVASCSNSVWDQATETDVDCGAECGPCDNGRNCLDNDDCRSRLCDVDTCTECSASSACGADYYCDNPLGGDCRLKGGLGSFCVSDGMCETGCCSFVCVGNC